MTEQAEFTYSSLEKAFEKQTKTIEKQGKKHIKTTEDESQKQIKSLETRAKKIFRQRTKINYELNKIVEIENKLNRNE